MYELDPEKYQKSRADSEPSNLEIIGAYAPSDHLQLYHVGNTAQEKLYILASSRRYANIIAMMGGHIRSLRNATHWKPVPLAVEGSALSQALRDALPGVVSLHKGCVITRDRVFYDREPRAKIAR